MDERNENYEIDLLQLLKVILNKWWIVAIATVLTGAIVFIYTYFFVTPMYEASVLVYVNNSSISLGSQSLSISSSEISAAKTLVDTYCVILDTRLTLEDVIDSADLDYTYEELRKMITASAVNNTEIFRITVRNADPAEACTIANTIASILPRKISDVVEGSSVRIVDMAVVPSVRSSPSYSRNTAIGLLLGFVLGAAGIVVWDLLNDKLRSEDWILEAFNNEIPLLSVIPDIHSRDSGHSYYRDKYGYYSSYSQESNSSNDNAGSGKKSV